MSINYSNLENLTKAELIDSIKEGIEEKKSLEYLLDNLHGISWEFDLLQNKFTYVSSSAKKILGYELNEWIDLEAWALMVHVDDRERVTTYCATQTQDGKDHAMEYKMVKKTGEIIWVLDVVTLAKDEKGNPVKLFGFILDISERKEEELKLQEEHQFLQTIIDGIIDPVMIINADYTVPLMNETVRKNLEDRTFLDKLNPKCYEISHYRDSPCEGVDDPCPLKEVLESSKATKVMHNHKHADGSDQFVELSASPLFDSCQNCTGIIESARDITEYVQLANELKEKSILLDHQAHHDYLTGLPNRALFMDRLEQGLKDARRNKKGLTLFFMDLDHFKQINDTHGHEMGDKVLIEVCKKFSENTRQNDVLCRLGGDEFTVILKDMQNQSDIKKVAQKFIDIFKEPLVIDNHQLKLSVSIGITVCVGKNINSETLLNEADTAMYEAKEQGKNTFTFFEKEVFRYSEVSTRS